MRGGGAVLRPVTEILAALLGGPVLRGAEVEEVVNHVFLRQRAGHERERFVHRVGCGEGDEHLRKLAVHEVALVRITRGKLFGRELHHVGGRQAVAGDADLEDTEFVELLALQERGERPLAERAEALVLRGLAAETGEGEQSGEAAVSGLLRAHGSATS